ncbi:hypothetical protein Fmac_028571 [Flemingia macrophylla]|uniref:Uncharacterized protein n=1 Tax=Flemingia macrophylla TaxID=520843 RepID=A0ABD1L7V3_9FABA
MDEHPKAYAANTYSRPPHSRDKPLDREDGSQLLANALVNLVTQLAANQKPAESILPMTTTVVSVFHRNNLDSVQEMMPLSLEEFMMWLQIHLFETRKLEGKLDALVNLVTHIATSQKLAFVARVCGICSSNDHHTSLCPSSQQSGVDENPDFSAINDVIVMRGVHDVAIDTSAETRKLEGMLDALVNLVTLLVANQKLAPIALVCGIRYSNDHITSLRIRSLPLLQRVCGIRSSNDHHTSVCPSSQQSGVDEHPESYATSTYSRPPQQLHEVDTDTSTKTTKLEGKLDALVNLVTQLAANQKSASVARVCDIRSSNDHHASVWPSSQQSGVDEHPEAYAFGARNDAIVIRGVHDMASIVTSTKTRKLEGKLDALVNFVTRLAANRSFASIARVWGILSSNDHHTSVYHSSLQSGVEEHPEAYLCKIL